MIDIDDYFGGLTEEEYVRQTKEHFKWLEENMRDTTLEEPNFTELKNPFIRDSFKNEACENCPSNPKNGGTGICFCTLGTPVIY